MARLPNPGSDNNVWGNILNDFLSVELNSDGTLKTSGTLSSYASRASNLSDLTSISTARSNLGLGDAATKNTGTAAGTVAAGNDSRITGAIQTSLFDAAGDLVVGTADNTVARLPAGTDGTVLTATATGVEYRLADPNQLAAGATAVPRWLSGMASTSYGTSGVLRLMYFTAPRSETLAQIAITTGNTAAGATPTLCRMGIYSVAVNGDLALLAACANDTTLFGTITTRYVRSLTSSAALTGGQRYALGVILVTGAAVPTFLGPTVGSSAASLALAPRLTGQVTGQTDLPASVTAGTVGSSGQAFQMEILP